MRDYHKTALYVNLSGLQRIRADATDMAATLIIDTSMVEMNRPRIFSFIGAKRR